MTHLTCVLTAKNRDQLRNPTLGNRVCATFLLIVYVAGVRRCDVYIGRAQSGSGCSVADFRGWLRRARVADGPARRVVSRLRLGLAVAVAGVGRAAAAVVVADARRAPQAHVAAGQPDVAAA